MYKETLSKDLAKFDRIGAATIEQARPVTKLGLALLFLLIVWIGATIASAGGEQRIVVIIAGIIGGYMALNIGANDVANNVGAAVGSRALTMLGALIIASIFEAMGAIVAGGDVVSTISKGIIAPEDFPSSDLFIWSMLSALLAAALWVNIATMLNAPVSTTHSIVGGVIGAGIAAVGFSVINWPKMGMIAASWIISPVMGGAIAAIFLAFIKANIIYRDDKIAGAKRWVPILVAIMAGVFSAYLVMKGLKRVWRPDGWTITAIGVAIFALTYVIVNPLIKRQAEGMENRNKSVRALFTIPLICSAALLSFAHGSNDVANAVGPLAAIVGVAESGEVAAKVEIPLWVMFIGAAGISAGLLLFGPKLIRTVGQQITKMNPMRAYCVALSAAITVIIASTLGLPVSSTHIAVGAVFGVGFYREWQTARRTHINHGRYGEAGKLKAARDADAAELSERALRRKLVRRSHLTTIAAAWVITVPASAVIAGAIFWVIQTVRGF
ncbi:MAG: inorganic phosphate transporter [Rhodospirillaceae bacterium]|jgi:inorganic phosphate transporter, PiT family|nr:inorganic phosphate transporter [Rhodospirillaceae bacterium]MBT5126938.1 inorganic phosphate transporter [Rhodospirillaceae bacterium]MBT6678437.1 inorganic phosphate transporter [Rhodospirillaceae bacterium]MBT6976447.1 inorganic phosphate transporter [Rhodospirillaceae bacterium]MBT7633807.1 inorganic phosphate transporter [Rhodospirillaceae bacterium]